MCARAADIGAFATRGITERIHHRRRVASTALLTEVLLKLGFSLTEKVEHITVAGLEVFSVADGLLLAYLNEHVTPTLDQLRELLALEPERLVILDDAFKGKDELKTNLVQECRTHNVNLWTA